MPKYELGDSVIVGSGNSMINQSQVLQIMNEALLPHFDVSYCWDGLTDSFKQQIPKENILASNYPSSYYFGESLFFDGTQYGVEWGEPIPYNCITRDVFHLDKGATNEGSTDRISLDLTTSYGLLDGVIFDNRCSAYHLYIQIEVTKTNLGSRTLAIMSRIEHKENIFPAELFVLMSATQIPAIDGGNQLNFENSYVELNLLEHLRKVVTKTQYKGDIKDLKLSLQLTFHQTSGLEAGIYSARLWARKVNQLIDPDMFKG